MLVLVITNIHNQSRKISFFVYFIVVSIPQPLIFNQKTGEKKMKTSGRILLIVSLITLGSVSIILPHYAQAHCQLPCGIYDDHARYEAMLEHVATLEKSDKMIAELTGKTDAQSQNQLVRWIMNKEDHSQKIISVICDYFLTQRINPEQKDYSERLAKHHAVIVAAMKTKQNADAKYVKNLRTCIEALSAYYPDHS